MPAVTDTGFVEMRLAKVVGIGSADGEVSCVVVLLRRALEAGQMTIQQAPRDR
jgi:hypothetical protein